MLMWELFPSIRALKSRELRFFHQRWSFPESNGVLLLLVCNQLFVCARALLCMCVCVSGEDEDLHRKFEEEEEEEEALSEGIPFVWIWVPDYISSISACCSLSKHSTPP